MTDQKHLAFFYIYIVLPFSPLLLLSNLIQSYRLISHLLRLCFAVFVGKGPVAASCNPSLYLVVHDRCTTTASRHTILAMNNREEKAGPLGSVAASFLPSTSAFKQQRKRRISANENASSDLIRCLLICPAIVVIWSTGIVAAVDLMEGHGMSMACPKDELHI